MENSFSVKTSGEFLSNHLEFQSQILEELPTKWRNAFGSTVMDSSVEKSLKQKIDDSFKFLMKQFEKANVRNKEQLLRFHAQQSALQYYNDEMEKYFKNAPNASPKDIRKLHLGLVSKAIAEVRKKFGTIWTTELVEFLETELEKSQKLYTDKAQMNMSTLEDPAIGIDLGTTMCCVMVFHRGKPEIVPNRDQGNHSTTPSYVSYRADKSTTFGWVAKDEAYRFPDSTIYDAKRMIGREWNDEMLQEDRRHWPFETVQDDLNLKIKTWNWVRYPHEISARLLAHCRTMAEQYLNVPEGTVRKAVITVPAYFTEPQRRATNEAAMCAGIKVLNILSEPTAAAIAYSWQRTQNDVRKALIYDLGGGTFDIAIAEVSGNNVKILGVDGDTHLGGQDFDQILMKYCLAQFKEETGIYLELGVNSRNKISRDNALSVMTRVKQQCEKAKENLSTAESSNVEVMCVRGTTNLVVTITKSKLNELVRPLVQKTIDIVDRALEAARDKGIANKSDIQDIILVGGSTRMPLVADEISKYFDGKQLCKSINPDEAVAYGAAIQAALMNKDQAQNMKQISVQDVTPMTLGIKSTFDNNHDVYTRIIPKNSKIPCQFNKTFTTVEDNQTEIMFNIYQGENDIASENQWLGEFILYGVPPQPKGKEEAIVKMQINEMGILVVEAKSVSTGSLNAITITSEKLGMTAENIKQLTNEVICIHTC